MSLEAGHPMPHEVPEQYAAPSSVRPNPHEVTEQYAAFSAVVHETIFKLNGGILALLQLTATSSVFEANRVVFLCFCVLIFFYTVLRVCEAKYLKRRFGSVMRLIALMSHMFGVLAAVVLISTIYPIFALVLFILWFLCLFPFVYFSCSQLIDSSESPPA